MSAISFSIRLRHILKRVPGLSGLYSFWRLLFSHSYAEDGLITIHNSDFKHDPKFKRAYDQALKLSPDINIRWRAHVTQWAGHHAASLNGDFVECGVNRGFLSRSVMSYVDFDKLAPKRFFLFDTYCGLVPEQVTQEDKAAFWNEYEDVYNIVVEAFSNIPNVVIVKGVVPESFAQVDIDQVTYLSIDMNCVYPEVAALEYFWDKLVPGAVVILDDYGFTGHEAQKQGADRLAERKGVKILSLPTGQGMIIKPPG